MCSKTFTLTRTLIHYAHHSTSHFSTHASFLLLLAAVESSGTLYLSDRRIKATQRRRKPVITTAFAEITTSHSITSVVRPTHARVSRDLSLGRDSEFFFFSFLSCAFFSLIFSFFVCFSCSYFLFLFIFSVIFFSLSPYSFLYLLFLHLFFISLFFISLSSFIFFSLSPISSSSPPSSSIFSFYLPLLTSSVLELAFRELPADATRRRSRATLGEASPPRSG